MWTFGCESRVTSLVHDDRKVTAEQLNVELNQELARLEADIEGLIRKAELKKKELARQDEVKRKILEFAAITAEGGTFNAAGLIALVASVIGVGAVIDNRIKDKVIENRPIKSS